VLQLVSNAAGSPIDEVARRGDVWIEPGTILDECEVLGDRLARAASRGKAFVVATGHPTGLALLYHEIAKLMGDHGAKVLRLADGALWEDHHSGGWRQIRYLDGVGMVTDASSPKHTHAPHAMERMLDEGRPDLVLGDHGLAGAAIEVGIDTVSVADVNDPSLIVAKAVGRTEVVVVMDDNVAPDAYWPCFQMIASRFS
jgi:hypothetical protein